MLEPASAIGLASSIVQLVHFTKDVLSRSHELYTSANGSLVDNSDLEIVTSSLGRLLTNVNNRAPAHNDASTGTASELEMLSQELGQITQELLVVLKSLKVDSGNHAWSSIRQSLRSLWHERDLLKLEQRLERFRGQVDTTLLISLR
jgi:HAMP domain-containing protein